MAIKAQALANFIAEFTYDIAPESEMTLPKETPKKQGQEGNLAKWKLFMDGSSNQHSYGAGLVL